MGSRGCGSPRDARFAGLRSWKGAACLLVSGAAFAQDVRPGDELPPLPPFETRDEREAVTLRIPALAAPVLERAAGAPGAVGGDPQLDALRAGGRVFVLEVHLHGGGALPPERLAAIAAAYEARELSLAEIEDLRNALTQAYVEAGYLTSGAVIPDQSLADGVLDVEIVEGRLSGIEVKSEGRLRGSVIRRRLELALESPLDVNALRAQLQRARRDFGLRAVEAELVPGARRGEALLRVRSIPARPWSLTLGGDNHANPWLGEWRGTVSAGFDEPIGLGDFVALAYAGGEGLQDAGARYWLPFTPGATRLEGFVRGTWAEIVESGLGGAEDSETLGYGVGLAQPVLRRERSELEAFARGERRESRDFPFGSRFPEPEDGESRFTLLRVGVEWTLRGEAQVAALRAQLTRGFDALGATHEPSDERPDAEFFAALFQLRWARRLPLFATELHVRGQAQLASEPLLGLEQLSLGGRRSVRGYAEDQVVRDNGVVGSVELHIPVWLPVYYREWRPELVLVPFVDAGHAWNEDRGDLPRGDDETLVAPGIGARMRLLPRFEVALDWGYGLADVDALGDDSLQGDHGLHLGAHWSF